MKRTWLLGAALAATLGGAVPCAAAATIASDQLPSAFAVERFYDSRGQSLWLQAPSATQALLTALDQARIDGFARGPELAGSIRSALLQADAGTPGASREAERLMSNAFVMYAQALRWPGTARVIYADPTLSPRVPSPPEVLAAAAAAPDLAEHVRRTAAMNPLYASLKAAAADEIRLLGEPRRAVVASLDRLRQVTFNPYWNVPVDLAAKNIAPNVLRHGADWFRGRGYELLSGWGEGASVIDPTSIDWQAVAEGRLEARIRQKPGAGNMMGAMKFEFPNSNGIYLHDTPERALFAKADRTFSSGCVRLEDAARLGRWLLGREAVATSGEAENTVMLADGGVPVFLTYLTARAETDGSLASAADVYALDGGTGVGEPRRVAAR